MDEVLFRGSRKLEIMQVQAQLVASKTKEVFATYSQATKALISQAIHSNHVEQLKQNIAQLIGYVLEVTRDFKYQVTNILEPRRLWIFFSTVLGGKWSRREVSIACISFVIGGAVGLGVGLIIRRRETIYRYMEAIQISHYLGPEGATVVEDAHAPYECGQHDVLVEVKASSVQIIDAQICCGYGRTFRRILRRIYKQSSSDLPVILGRDCTGVITDLGKSVKRLEIGDEVWVTVPFWSQGTLCQTVLVSESRVARKPKNVGFEGACSIPYAGSLALSALTEANIDFSNAKDKRFLIQDGCTPVGCVLIQLLNNWRAHVTTSCYKRALPVAKALGATDIITIDDSHYVREVHEKDPQEIREGDQKLLLKELEVRGETFDVIVLTRNDCVDLSGFCTKNGRILCTAPEELLSDSCGFFSRLLLTGYVKLKIVIQNTLGLPSDTFDEAHLCHATLDRLTEMVEDGVLQTVVEKVYHPKDIEVALNHVQSPHSIGSTVVTFR